MGARSAVGLAGLLELTHTFLVMGRWFLLFALPILGCALIFEALLVPAEDFTVNFFNEGHSYGAPFVVGARPLPTRPPTPVPTPLPSPGPTPVQGAGTGAPERFSVLWFAVDVIVTAAIAFVIAWFLRIRNAWVPSVSATIAVGWLVASSSSSPPVLIRSFGFSYWIYWLVAFAIIAAGWTLYRTRARRG